MKKLIPLFFILSSHLLFAQTQKPNILFIIADDAGRDMSAYGRTWVKTPGFDKIAKNGVLFERAYTPNAKCAPSRANILTGRSSWQLDEACNHNIYFPQKFKTFTEALKDNGYFTGYIGKGYGPGKALNYDGTNRLLTGKAFNTKTTTPPTKGISANAYAENFKDFLDNSSKNAPWFCWLGFLEPHREYEYGSGVRSGKKLSDIQRVPSYFPDSDTIRNDLLDYALEIEYMDKHIEKVLKILEENGQLDNTIIVVTSDHGMPFPRVKGNQYEHANHIPMALMWNKGIATKGRKINDYVSFIDIAPTLLEVSGISENSSGMHPITGKSFVNLLQSSKSGQIDKNRDYLLVGQERHDVGRPHDEGYPIRGIHKNNFLYLRNYENSRYPACNPETGYLNTDGGATKTFIINQKRKNDDDRKYWDLAFGMRPEEELYNITDDPDCVKNLANEAKYNSLKTKLKQEMEAKLLSEGDLRMKGFGDIYESYPTVENVNFYERYMKGEKLRTPWVSASDYEKEAVKK